MAENLSRNSRVIRNTMFLYFRMLFMLLVSLYTSRVVLDSLGIVDFGIYNVVGGIVVLFSFIYSAMANVTQRYLTFELGRDNYDRLHKVFCVSINIHVVISLLIFVLSETIGLWFFYEVMNIPEGRHGAAMWVYQLSVLSSIVMIMSSPYNAVIIAHEKMGAFAYISFIEVFGKLAIVFLLYISPYDKLKVYALLLLAVQMFVCYLYRRYCKKHFVESHYKYIVDKPLLKDMTHFAGWSLWGNIAAITFSHGVNILLNVFFGPTVNAARGIAIQVQNAIVQFSRNFQMALNPQIVKSYASNDLEYMHKLIFGSSKYTFFLLYFLTLPVLLETPQILALWLKEIPDFTVVFLRLILCITLIDAMSNPLMVSAEATGRIKLYQSVVGGLLLMILPLSYLALKMGADASSVFIVHLCIAFVAYCTRLFILRSLVHLPLLKYVKEVIVRCVLVGICSLLLPIAAKVMLDETILNTFIILALSALSTACCIALIGLRQDERLFVREKIAVMIKKIRK